MDRIKDFPQDGQLWWIRWVDDVRAPSGRTGSPGIFVLLSLLKDGNLNRLPRIDEESRRAEHGSKISYALVGSTPGLAIGTVFRDGVRVGRLEAEETGLMTFDKAGSQSRIMPASAPSASAFPLWPKARPGYHLVPKLPYGIPGFHNGNCLVIHDATQAVVIPCFEVFRSFYAPHGDIALALTRGPWELEWKNVANPDDTRVLPDGSWQIGLRRRIRNQHAPLLANLIHGLVGHEAASEIFGSLLHSKQTPAQVLPFSHGQGGEIEKPPRERLTSSPLRARIPFEWEKLALKARCVCWNKSPDCYFAFEITEIAWPDAPFVAGRIDYDRDNSGRTGRGQAASSQARPFLQVVSELNLDEGQPVPVTTDEDPRPEPTSVVFPVAGPTWLNVPPLRPVLKPLSFTYENIQRLTRPEPAVQASAGSQGSAQSDSIRAQYVSTERSPLPHCFGQVLVALAQLEQDGEIAGWSIACPPCDCVEYRGGIPAWPVSGKKERKAWCWIDKPKKRRRAALVCEIHLDGTTLLWLDLEMRSSERGFCALLWHPPNRNWDAAIGGLLRIAVQERGVWLSRDKLAKSTEIPSIQKWRHYHDREDESRLNLKSLLSALKKAAAPPPRAS